MFCNIVFVGIMVTLAFNCVSLMIPTQFGTIFPEGFDSQT